MIFGIVFDYRNRILPKNYKLSIQLADRNDLVEKCKMTKIHSTRTITVSRGAGPQTSTISILCRICYDSDRDEELITPCNCKVGTTFSYHYQTQLSILVFRELWHLFTDRVWKHG